MADPIIVTQSSTGSSRWIMLNQHVTPFCVSLGVTVTTPVNYTVSYTYDDPLLTVAPSSQQTAIAWPLTVLSGQTAQKDLGVTNMSGLTNPVMAVNITVNSGTGSATLYVLQAGLRQS